MHPGLGNRGRDMNKTIVLAACAAVFLPIVSSIAAAGPLETACNRSDRKAASRSLCSCIGQVADMTLRPADQRRAAAFFKNPDKAQSVKMSKSNADDEFWDRYKAFGEQAEAYCAG